MHKNVVAQIRKATRRKYSAEEKIRIVLEGLRGEIPISELCRREGIAPTMYYRWSKTFLEAGKNGLTRDTLRDVEDFLDKLGPLSAKRKNNIMVPVKCLFNNARRRGEIRNNPTELIRRFKEEKPFIDPFSFPEMKAFLANVNPHYVPYYSTAFLSGMRPNEMLALKWLHVDFDMRAITVREGRVQGFEGPPKTLSSYRDIDMLDPLYEVLRQHRLTTPQDVTHVFTNKHGNPLAVDNLRNKVWYPALQRAKLRKRTMYQTRNTFASLMLSHGEDPLWVARMLGHTTLQMVYQHYGKFIRNRMRRDGLRFTQGLAEAGGLPGAAIDLAETKKSASPLPERTCGLPNRREGENPCQP